MMATDSVVVVLVVVMELSFTARGRSSPQFDRSIASVI
jgi:hypothetical protein